MGMGEKRPVLHTLEFLAQEHAGEDWRRKFRTVLLRSAKTARNGLRGVDVSDACGVELSAADKTEEDEEA
jgi:hypothetical protein